jgi:predicted patatin/cPLA2 family phospholipase
MSNLKKISETKRTLIIEGGGFRTGFSTGVLDAFQTYRYNKFDFYIGISGGAIALSYYLSRQYQCCFDAICLLATDKKFINYNRMMSPTGVMNIDYFQVVANTKVPLNIKKVIANSKGKKNRNCTNKSCNGKASLLSSEQ